VQDIGINPVSDVSFGGLEISSVLTELVAFQLIAD
jgi:hypothetical protein